MSLVVDSSVLVKWFKKGEEFEDEALKLRQGSLSSTVSATVSELLPLEVCRALVKAGYPRQKVDESYATVSEMIKFGFLKVAPLTAVRDEAKGLIFGLNLYVADAISLATALVNSADLLTEDRHLLKQKVKELVKGRGLRILRLRDIYS